MFALGYQDAVKKVAAKSIDDFTERRLGEQKEFTRLVTLCGCAVRDMEAVYSLAQDSPGEFDEAFLYLGEMLSDS